MPAFPGLDDPADAALITRADALLDKLRDAMDRQAFHEGLRDIWEVIAEANRYIDTAAPWALKKTDPARMAEVLAVLAEAVRQFAILVQPFMPEAASRLLDQLGVAGTERGMDQLGGAARIKAGQTLEKPSGVFPRYQEKEEG